MYKDVNIFRWESVADKNLIWKFLVEIGMSCPDLPCSVHAKSQWISSIHGKILVKITSNWYDNELSKIYVTAMIYPTVFLAFVCSWFPLLRQFFSDINFCSYSFCRCSFKLKVISIEKRLWQWLFGCQNFIRANVHFQLTNFWSMVI